MKVVKRKKNKKKNENKFQVPCIVFKAIIDGVEGVKR